MDALSVVYGSHGPGRRGRPRADRHAARPLRLQLACSSLLADVRLPAGRTTPLSRLDEGSRPRHRLSLRSGLNLGSKTHVPLWGRCADRPRSRFVPANVTLDPRPAWQPRPGTEVSVAGWRLLHRRLCEVAPDILNALPTAVERGEHWEGGLAVLKRGMECASGAGLPARSARGDAL